MLWKVPGALFSPNGMRVERGKTSGHMNAILSRSSGHLPITAVLVKCKNNFSAAEGVEAIIYARNRVSVEYGDGFQAAIVDTES